MEPYEIEVVTEDLEHLCTDWARGPSEADVRRGSAVLRRLLVEDTYGNAWRAVGFAMQPKVVAVDIHDLLGDAQTPSVVLAMAGGVTVGGVSIAGSCFLKGVGLRTPRESPPLLPDGFPGEREYSLSEYLASPAAIVGGHRATRRDVIKYFANVKGGVHIGGKQRRAEAKLIARMTKFEKRVSILNRDGLATELLAIGQALARSPDTLKFIERVRQ